MTIYNLRKTPLSPFLTRMITREYKDKLERLSSHCLSDLLCSLGILEFEQVKSSSSDKYVSITNVNRSVYDSYNGNIFFQCVVCYHLDSLGLLYTQPRVYFEKSCQIKGLKFSHTKLTCSFMSTRVRIPAGCIPQSRYESRKKTPNQCFHIDKSLKFDPESFKTITVEEVDELKRQAFLKQENHHYYLHSERNRAIKVINERRDLTSEQKKLRIARIDEKYQRNLTKYMGDVVSNVKWVPNDLRQSESDIAQKERSFLDLTTQLVNLKVAEQMANDEQEKQLATQRRIELEVKQNQAETSLIQAKIHLAYLKVYYQAISTEATAVQQQLATPELQELYFAGIQARKTHESLETSIKFFLSDFDKNNHCIHQLDNLITNVESNLGQIQDVVDKNYRVNCMLAKFDVSTKKVHLYLNNKKHIIELSHYLHHLKEGTRNSDIERIEMYISEICSNLSGWIASLSGLNPRVEQDLSKIRDTVKFYWRASFNISTKKVCLIYPTDKVEHLNIPEYVEYLRRKIGHFQEILEEKKRMCK